MNLVVCSKRIFDNGYDSISEMQNISAKTIHRHITCMLFETFHVRMCTFDKPF